MKKNWTMRVALLIVALALITSCFVSGTYAKYITSTSATDTARVAKFGVLLSANGGDLFATQYQKHDNTYTKGDYTVISSNTDKVVAPGTSSADLDADVKFAITGTPEVAVRTVLEFGENLKEVVLPKGTYRDYTVSDPTATFTLSEDYYPVVFTLKQGTNEIASGTLADIKEAVEAAGADYAPNTVLDAEFVLSWEWVFEQTTGTGSDAQVNHLIDQADTYLGNVAAGIVDNVPTGVCTQIAYTVNITVTQID